VRLTSGGQAFLNRLVNVWGTRFRRRQAAAVPPAALSPLRVVVNGGGPAGLMYAATAYAAGAEVAVIERQAEYERDVWFD
jgi:NADPH-dependent 2,4-dienoyl-CoA reductase/sulfur reductase-like enzyme